MRSFKILLLSICAAAPLASAATFVVPSDRELVRRSDVIVTGSALGSYSQRSAEGGIETVTSFAVDELIKGGSVPHMMNVVEPGGRLDDSAMLIAGAPRFDPGQRYLLFLKATGPRRWSVTELLLGKFRFADDISGSELLLRDEEEVVGWDSDLRPHREPHRSAARFLDFVRDVVRGIHAPETYVVPSTPVTNGLSIAPNATFTATSYTMSIGSNGQGSRWNVFPGGVTFFTGSTTEPGAPGGGVTAVQTGIASWDNDPGSNVNYVYGGTDTTHTLGLQGPDGANTVLFERDLSAYGVAPFTCSSTGYSGTLGLGGITSASGSNTVNGEQFLSTQEGDVEMNKGLANCTLLFSNGDFNTAVAHELGHTLGFRHADQNRTDTAGCSTDPSLECSSLAVMRSFVPTGINATLQSWDIDAVRAVYPGPVIARTHGDFNGDGKADILLRDSAGNVILWTMNGPSIVSSAVVDSPGTIYNVAGVGDFNGDGKADVLLRDIYGSIGMWIMNGSTITQGALVDSPGTNYTIAGVADFNGDGKADVLLRDSSGGVGMWIMDGTRIVSGSYVGSLGTIYTIVGVADFNGDGKADILLRDTNGSIGMWIMNGPSIVQGAFVDSPGLAYTIAGVGDFSGDGKADVLLRDSSGNLGMWIMNGTKIAGGSFVGSPGLSYTVAAVNDYNGDGKADILLKNTNGTYVMWLMSGPTILSSTTVANPGTGFTAY